MTRILLVRHGQSEWNALGRWQGQADPPLTDLGRQQALTASASIGSVDAVFASTLERARVTAGIIAGEIGIGPVAALDGLMERDAGPWSGLTKADIEEKWPGYLAKDQRPDGYEETGPFLERICVALQAIATVHPTGDVVAVTHGGVMYTLNDHLGVETPRISNLAARWIGVEPDGQMQAGDEVKLISDELSTVPGQI